MLELRNFAYKSMPASRIQAPSVKWLTGTDRPEDRSSPDLAHAG
jgi:hypothetical protein